MKFNKLLIAMASVAMLVACAPTNSSSNNPGGDNSSNVPDTSEHADTETPDLESYSVKIVNTNTNVTLTSNKAKAKQGETVTITAKVNDANYKVTKVLYDNNECAKVNDETYTFVMPDHPVKVTCQVLVNNGDVTLQGGVTAVFEKEGDKYVARNVKVDKDTTFSLIVKDKDGSMNSMEITKFDRTKTFANIGFAYNDDYDLRIAGGATYDFYYDVNNGARPCYVVRTNIDKLPTSADTLYSLFSGSIGSNSSVNPLDLVSTTYFNGAAKEKMVWEAYDDNSSLATISDLKIDGSYKQKAVVYGKIEGDTLTYVDSYVPGVNKAHKENYNLSRDLDKYSGLYKISEQNQYGENTNDVEFRYNQDYVNPKIADLLINTNPFDMQTFEADIMHGYRVGFVKDDGISQSDVAVSSKEDEGGNSFTTTLVSSRTYDSSKDRGASGSLVQNHFEYRMSLTFTNAGALLNGTYEERVFEEADYNFSTNSWVMGDAQYNWENTGKDVNLITISNEYGAKKAAKSFDTTPYFVNEITKLTINNPNADNKDGNAVNIGDVVSDYTTFEFLPFTALNAHQYKLVKSSDENVVGKKDGARYTAIGSGNANLTLGIANGLGITSSVNVTVVGGQKIRSIILYSAYSKYPNVETANSGTLYAGNFNEYGILVYAAKNNKNMPMPADISAEFVGESLGIKPSFDHEKQTLILDATAVTVTESTTLTLQINTASYDLVTPENPKGWVSAPITFTFKVLPGISGDALIGTWNAVDPSLKGSSITFTKEKVAETTVGYNELRPYLGTINCSEGTLKFSYSFDASKNALNVGLLERKNDLSTFEIAYDSSKNELSAILVLKVWDTEQTPDVEVFGYEDGDTQYLDIFRKAN